MESYIIAWRNKYSGEQGWVKAMNTKGRYFVNTYKREDAKRYKDKAAAKGVVTKLISYGEGAANDFEILLADPIILE